MQKSLIFIVVAGLVLGAGAFYFLSTRGEKPAATMPPFSIPLTPDTAPSEPLTTKSTGIEEKKSLHFENSAPAHNQVFAATPFNIVINFNFDLATGSKITIEKDGVDYGDGNTVIDSSKLALRRRMKTADNGIYIVEYTACWPDKTCHDGQFGFIIDTNQAVKYQDLTGQEEVQVNLSNTAFAPAFIIVSKGTKVTWTNKEAVEHYVNGDPHAGHDFLLDWNSKALAQGATYSYTFNNIGEYPYHCSAHASEMIGRIIVR